MAVIVVNSATLVNTTITQSANYTVTYTAGSNPGTRLILFCLGLKNTNSDLFTTNPMAITLNGNAISDTNSIYETGSTHPNFATGTYLANPISGSNTITIVNSYSFRCFAAFIVEVAQTLTTNPAATKTSSANYTPVGQNTVNATMTVSPATTGLLVGGGVVNYVSGASTMAVSSGATLLTAQNSPGTGAGSDGCWCAFVKPETAMTSDTYYIGWASVAGTRGALVSFLIAEDPAISGVNKIKIGTVAPTKGYVGNTVVKKMYIGNTTVFG